jgi:hypothetical protein
LSVSLIFNQVESARLDAVVDSGSPFCLFHASIGTALGIDLGRGRKGLLSGAIAGAQGEVYYHNVSLRVLGSLITTFAGFSPALSVAALLGRVGFFDNFRVTFNPDYEPPGMEIERVHRT